MGNGAKRIIFVAIFIIVMAGVIFATFRDKDSQTDKSNLVADASTMQLKENDNLSSDSSEEGAQSSIEGPRIKFDNKVKNFGKTSAGESVKHTFKFKNLGSETLVIEKVKSG